MSDKESCESCLREDKMFCKQWQHNPDMMSDKKSCDNCWHGRPHVRPSQVPCPQKKCDVCEKWQRNPVLWLSIRPTEIGYYWHKQQPKNFPWIDHVAEYDLEYGAMFKRKTDLWQGPLAPNQ